MAINNNKFTQYYHFYIYMVLPIESIQSIVLAWSATNSQIFTKSLREMRETIDRYNLELATLFAQCIHFLCAKSEVTQFSTLLFQK